jgi:hypothetical protein
MLPAWMLVLSSLGWSAGCSDDPAPANSGGGGGGGGDEAPAERVEIVPEVPDSVEVGGFSLVGAIIDEYSGAPSGGGLCVDVVDPSLLGLGVEFTPLASTVADGEGAFQLDDVPVATATGLLLRVRGCDGDDSAYFPTATLISVDAWAGLGPDDTLTGQVAWVFTAQDAADLNADMSAVGTPRSIDEVGALMGHVYETDGSPLPNAALRGPDATRVQYDFGDGTWPAYESTRLEGDARWISPGAPYALWTCRVLEHTVPSVIMGAVPGWIVRWDYRATVNFNEQ